MNSVDDALDRLERIHISHFKLGHPAYVALATVREALAAKDQEIERLRKIERNSSVLFDEYKAAEAEVKRLREERSKQIGRSNSAILEAEARAQDLAAEVKRLKGDKISLMRRVAQLTEGLRLALAGLPDPMHPSIPPQFVDVLVASQIVMLDALGDDDPGDVDKARALLAGSEAEPDGPPEGFQWDYIAPDPDDPSGERWGWMNEAGEVWTGPDGGGAVDCEKCGHVAHVPGGCSANVGTGYFGPVLCRCGVDGGAK